MANHLNDYANNLDPYVKKRYYEKISCVGIGPILIPGKAYDPDCLPRAESIDLRLSFLVLETSSFRVCELRERVQNRKQLHCSRKSEAFTENGRSVCCIVDYNRLWKMVVLSSHTVLDAWQDKESAARISPAFS